MQLAEIIPAEGIVSYLAGRVFGRVCATALAAKSLRTAAVRALLRGGAMMRLSISLTALALALGAGCATTDEDEIGPPPVAFKADDPAHVQATNCEVFIDKIVAFQGSHASRAVTIFVKTLSSRFDSEVVEVGFRNRIIGAGAQSWQDRKFSSFWGASDYFQSAFTVSSDWGRSQYEGALYARTSAGTTYWFKPTAESNFFFDNNTHDNVMHAMGKSYNYDSSINAAVGTQRADLTYFNPAGCY